MAAEIEMGGWVRGKRYVAGANVAGAKIYSLVFELASRWCAIRWAVDRPYLEYPDVHLYSEWP